MLELVTVERDGQLVLVVRPTDVDEKIVQMCPWYYVEGVEQEEGTS